MAKKFRALSALALAALAFGVVLAVGEPSWSDSPTTVAGEPSWASVTTVTVAGEPSWASVTTVTEEPSWS
jgi:hypothetical protein